MINFDNAATTFPKPRSVRQAMEMAMLKYGGNAGRGGHQLTERTSEQVFAAREEAAAFFGGKPENTIFCLNCTHALNLAIQGIVQPNDHVIISNLEQLYWYDGVSYVAYYPYRRNITIDVSKGMDGAIASLTGNEKLQPSKDQSTTEKHIVSDLLIATGVPAIDNSSGIILSLQFQHQFALLVLQPQVYVGCFAPEKAGFVYHMESRVLGTDSVAINVSLNGITPYQIDSLKYCAIVPPQANARVTGNYTTTNGRDDTNIKINYSGSSITLVSGKCYTLKVISPVPGKGSIERKLYPGDFIFQNEIDRRIEVHPGNGMLEEDGKIYDYKNAIGMVITCDPKRMTDKKCNEKGWNHAYVMMLDSLKEGNWGPVDLIEVGIDTISIADVKSKHDFSRIKNNMNGYSETLQMLANHEGEVGDWIVACDGNGTDYVSRIQSICSDEVVASIEKVQPTGTELPVRITLFQGMPKKDKLELIIQKAVELGACEIVPVMTKRTVVKLSEEKKINKRLERWQSIAYAAAKQCDRGIIPTVHKPVSYEEALAMADQLDYNVIPYELQTGMEEARKIVDQACKQRSLGIFIGPEGGFEPEEVERAMTRNIHPMTLGKRILRTETAGMALLSILMFQMQGE